MLDNEKVDYQKENKKWLMLLIASMVLIYFTKGLTIVFVIFSAFMIVVNKKRTTNVKKMVPEVDKLPEWLLELPLTYRSFKNIEIVVNDVTYVLDYVVVGPNGVFLFKKIWRNGEVVGRLEDEFWTSSDSSSEFKNPIKRAAEEVVTFSTYLKEKKLQSWVQGIVYFGNGDNVLNVSEGTIPVFMNNPEENNIMLDYIRSYQKEILMDAKKEDLMELIKGLEKK